MDSALTVGEVLQILEEMPSNKVAKNGWDGWFSDRGFYEVLALQPVRHVNVESMIQVLEAALEAGVMTGYKGGEYPITKDTSCKIGQWGSSGNWLTPTLLRLMIAFDLEEVRDAVS